MSGPLIGFSGYARSGKDTAAQTLGEGWQRISFADKLRDFLLALDPFVTHEYDSLGPRISEVVSRIGWEAAKDGYPEVRALLQRCGTEAGRKVLGPDVWVDAALRDWTGGPAYVSDVRFPNEAAAIHAQGGIVIRIDRPDVGPKVGEDGTVHESETALDLYLDGFEGRVVNDGTLDDLRVNVLAVVSEWFPEVEALG